MWIGCSHPNHVWYNPLPANIKKWVFRGIKRDGITSVHGIHVLIVQQDSVYEWVYPLIHSLFFSPWELESLDRIIQALNFPVNTWWILIKLVMNTQATWSISWLQGYSKQLALSVCNWAVLFTMIPHLICIEIITCCSGVKFA